VTAVSDEAGSDEATADAAVGDGIVHAGVFDGRGGARPVDWAGVRGWKPADGALWVHLDYAHETSRAWLEQESGIDPVALSALLADDPRPRGVSMGDALLVVFRGINVNRGAQPEDMVALRMWVEAGRVITLRHRRLTAGSLQWNLLVAGRGAVDPADLLLRLCEAILRRIGTMVHAIDETVDELEDMVLAEQREELRHRLAEVRRQAIGLRRFVGPQRDALANTASEEVSWLHEPVRLRLREATDRMHRIIEELDAARDRAAVTQEELTSRTSELINRRLYVLSVVAAVFLPLGLVTGLVGSNVGGIPLTGNPYGFLILLGALVAISVGQFWLFRKLGWL
jgi:zinc transporter